MEYYGAAHTQRVSSSLSYIISGSKIGAVLYLARGAHTEKNTATNFDRKGRPPGGGEAQAAVRTVARRRETGRAGFGVGG